MRDVRIMAGISSDRRALLARLLVRIQHPCQNLTGGDNMTDLKSFWRGIQAMPDRFQFWNPKYWKITKLDPIKYPSVESHFWMNIWTPTNHVGRGPYITIGLRFFAIHRGY